MKNIIKTLMSIAVCITMASCSNGQSSEATQTNTGTELQQGNYQDAGASGFHKMWQEKEGKLLDVRTPEEFAEGHIPGAVMIDYLSDDFQKKVAELDKDTTYLLYCRSGRRSQMAGEQMEKMGFKVVNLRGGFISWENQGYETEN